MKAPIATRFILRGLGLHNVGNPASPNGLANKLLTIHDGIHTDKVHLIAAELKRLCASKAENGVAGPLEKIGLGFTLAQRLDARSENHAS